MQSLFFSTHADRVALARQRYFEEGELPSGIVSEAVFQSWARCLRQKQDPRRQLEFQPVSASRAQLALQKNRLLPVNPRTGERLFSGLPVGSESQVFGLAFQGDTVSWPSQQLYMFKWAPGANWNYSTFEFDHDMDAVDARLASIMNANDSDLSRFKETGGKLMMFNGTADPGVPFQSN